MRRSDYPENWPEIRARILERAKDQRGVSQCECEGECGLHHTHRCLERHHRAAIWARGKVTLTTAHLCHNTQCFNEDHLKAMCQRCHLRYDMKLHVFNRAVNLEAGVGQSRLFDRGVNEVVARIGAAARRKGLPCIVTPEDIHE